MIALLGIVTVKLIAVVDGVEHFLNLKDVLHASDIMHDLLSIFRARKRGFLVCIDEDPEDSTSEKWTRSTKAQVW